MANDNPRAGHIADLPNPADLLNLAVKLQDICGEDSGLVRTVCNLRARVLNDPGSLSHHKLAELLGLIQLEFETIGAPRLVNLVPPSGSLSPDAPRTTPAGARGSSSVSSSYPHLGMDSGRPSPSAPEDPRTARADLWQSALPNPQAPMSWPHNWPVGAPTPVYARTPDPVGERRLSTFNDAVDAFGQAHNAWVDLPAAYRQQAATIASLQDQSWRYRTENPQGVDLHQLTAEIGQHINQLPPESHSSVTSYLTAAARARDAQRASDDATDIVLPHVRATTSTQELASDLRNQLGQITEWADKQQGNKSAHNTASTHRGSTPVTQPVQPKSQAPDQ